MLLCYFFTFVYLHLYITFIKKALNPSNSHPILQNSDSMSTTLHIFSTSDPHDIFSLLGTKFNIINNEFDIVNY